MAEEKKKILIHTADGDHVVSVGEHKPKQTFGGGGGAGVTIAPVAFIAVSDGSVKMMPVYNELSSAEKAFAMAPEVIERAKELFSKNKSKNAD